MSHREVFGPRLRAERERRGVSLETIAFGTKVPVELWEGLERNDLARWPSGIFARAFVRDYAKAIGLDADEVVDEFCRLYSIADRRAERVLRAQGELLGHPVALDRGLVPATGDRRASGRMLEEQARARRIRLAPRTLAAALDTAGALLLATAASLGFGSGFWTTTGAVGLAYYAISTMTLGNTPGTRAVAALRQRAPALFAIQERGAHA